MDFMFDESDRFEAGEEDVTWYGDVIGADVFDCLDCSECNPGCD